MTVINNELTALCMLKKTFIIGIPRRKDE